MKKQPRTSNHPNAWWLPQHTPLPWVNAEPIDYNYVVNKPSTWGVNFLALDFWSSAGATGDASYREMSLLGNNGDMTVTYTNVLLYWLGTTTYKLTKQYSWIEIVDNFITLPAWKVCRIQWQFSSTTQYARFIATWSKRFLRWSSLDLTSANPEVTFINTWADTTLTINFATTASDRPIFGIFLEII